MSKKIPNGIVWKTQVCDIFHYPGELDNAPVEAVFDTFGMAEIHPMNEKVE